MNEADRIIFTGIAIRAAMVVGVSVVVGSVLMTAIFASLVRPEEVQSEPPPQTKKTYVWISEKTLSTSLFCVGEVQKSLKSPALDEARDELYAGVKACEFDAKGDTK